MNKRLPAAVLSSALALAACQPQSAPSAASYPADVLQQALGGDAGGYALAETPRAFEFPAEHGPHPAFRNEWWYYTGVLHTPQQRRFGFELTFFRVALRPPPATPAQDVAGWRSSQVWFAHFAVSDIASGRFYAFERVSRPAAGLAGARAEPFSVWLEDWRVGGRADWRLRAAQADLALALELVPGPAPVLNGEAGLSRKNALPGNASYYYSMPRIAARGELRLDGEGHDVRGLVWLDREWSSSALGPEQVGWDWFALHLDDGSNLMLYRLRNAAGEADPFSSGSWSFPDGSVQHLSRDMFSLTPRRFWSAPDAGRYPVDWTLRVPAADLELQVSALQDNQWLDLVVPYWEGAVAVSGRRGGAPLSGSGYLELTGYAAR